MAVTDSPAPSVQYRRGASALRHTVTNTTIRPRHGGSCACCSGRPALNTDTGWPHEYGAGPMVAWGFGGNQTSPAHCRMALCRT
eukprot:3455776-Prymnesium_polylepis.1